MKVSFTPWVAAWGPSRVSTFLKASRRSKTDLECRQVGVVLIGPLGCQPVQDRAFLLQSGNQGLALHDRQDDGRAKQQKQADCNQFERILKDRAVACHGCILAVLRG